MYFTLFFDSPIDEMSDWVRTGSSGAMRSVVDAAAKRRVFAWFTVESRVNSMRNTATSTEERLLYVGKPIGATG